MVLGNIKHNNCGCIASGSAAISEELNKFDENATRLQELGWVCCITTMWDTKTQRTWQTSVGSPDY